MKFELRAIDKKRGEYSCPVSSAEMGALYDLYFMLLSSGAFKKELKSNNIDTVLQKFFKTAIHMSNDVLYDGGAYEMVRSRSGDIKLKRSKDKYYMIKKPKWRKNV